MELIKVSKNIMINPHKISCLMQKSVKGNAIVSVIVDGNTYEVDDPQEFLAELNRYSSRPNQQYFAG